MDEIPENKVMAPNLDATQSYKSICCKIRPLIKRVKDGSCRVFCRRCVIFVLLVVVVLLSSIIYAIYHYADTLPGICNSKNCLRSAAALKQSMNLRVDPCEDFYSYVCGNWANDHPRRKSHSSHNWIAERQLKIDRNIRAHLETNITRADPKPVAQAKTMYKACLNEVDREEHDFDAGVRYLEEFGLPEFPTLLEPARISNQNFQFDWISSIAKIRRKLGIDVIFTFCIVQDHLNKSRSRLTFSSACENDGKVSLEDVKEVLIQMANVIDQSVETDYKKEQFLFLATQFEEFDNRLPNRSESGSKNISYYTLQELQHITDEFIAPKEPLPIWQRYVDIIFAGLPEATLTAEDKLQIYDVDIEYLERLIDVMSKEKPAQIELYIWGKVVSFLVTNEFSRSDGEESCADSVHNLMGQAVSYAIADKDFLTETKPRIERMFREIRMEFDKVVLKTDWMDAYTKNATLEKSKAMDSVIGLPEWILNVEKLVQYYQGLQVSDSQNLENWVNAVRVRTRERLRSWRATNEHIWNSIPTQVNAAFLPDRNAINIPIAIIQNPFYHLGLEALNYGGLGTVLGHELTHGFDNSGINYDKHGNKKRWWPKDILQEYNERASCFVQQYSRYYVPEAKGFVNGTLTLGENIADNGGLRDAFNAYRTYVKEHGSEPILPGFEQFTHEQLFFLSFGNIYCEALPPSISQQEQQDVHSPNKFRVQGVLSNMEEFSEAFNCPLGSTMNPRDKCRIW